jgi:hypothetical protein
VKGRDVLFRYDQKVHWRLGRDVVEGNNLVIFVNFLCGDTPGHDLAKQAVHGISPDSNDGQCSRAFFAGTATHGANA